MRNDVFITYRHLRRRKEDGNYDVGGATICAKVDLRHPTIRTITFAFSLCSPKDAFNKVEGRYYAYLYLKGDAKIGNEVTIPYDEENTIVGAVLTYIGDHPEDFPMTTKHLNKYVF